MNISKKLLSIPKLSLPQVWQRNIFILKDGQFELAPHIPAQKPRYPYTLVRIHKERGSDDIKFELHNIKNELARLLRLYAKFYFSREVLDTSEGILSLSLSTKFTPNLFVLQQFCITCRDTINQIKIGTANTTEIELMLTTLHLYLSKAANPKKKREITECIESIINHIQELLDRKTRETIDLIKFITQSFQSQTSSARIPVQLDIQVDYSQIFRHLAPQKLQTLLLNIISNAISAANAHPTARSFITLAIRQTNFHIVVEIQNSGKKCPDELKESPPRSPSSQFRETSLSTGVGIDAINAACSALNVTNLYTDLHQGSVRVGTSCKLLFPTMLPDFNTLPDPKSKAPSKGILVIEDATTNLRIMQRGLINHMRKKLKYPHPERMLDLASCFKHAVHLLQTRRYHQILCDYNIIGTSEAGDKLAIIAHQHQPSANFQFATGEDRMGTRRTLKHLKQKRGWCCGSAEVILLTIPVIHKPVDINTLRKIVDTLPTKPKRKGRNKKTVIPTAASAPP